MHIDLNSDLGESYGPWVMGDDEAMLDVVTSANIACGGHAGDPHTMFQALQRAMHRGVVVGAHPGYPDREGFGRRVMGLAPAEIAQMLAAQIGALQGVAALTGAQVRYVKPHGALANRAAAESETAQAIAAAIAALPGNLAVLAISGTKLEKAAKAVGLPVYSEIYADRTYLPNGLLVPRTHPDAVLHDPHRAAQRLLRFLETGHMPTLDGPPVQLAAHSICVHGDTAGAVGMAQIIRDQLESAGITIQPFLVPSD